ncbi:hypothetical protein BDR03DRAFT_974926 [Suillus americanus]|nr:hypothetical protein BDR03DRAFT_974926 [Suillus americanus]
MTLVSDDSSWWSSINLYSVASYYVVAAAVIVMYDWALTFGQEVLRQRWSLMTVLYLSVRYLGMLYTIVPTILLTDAVSWIVYVIWDWTNVVIFPMLGVILIARLHAMYQHSRKILIFLVVTFLATIIFSGVAIVMTTMHTSGEELILSGTYQCTIGYGRDTPLLGAIAWILGTAWEIFALCLAVWVAVKHFSELRQHSAGGIIGDCFTIFVLGPRLILGIREYHANLLTNSDAATDMTSIAFRERVHISTGNGV